MCVVGSLCQDRLADEMMASLSQRARDISLGNELPKGFKVIQLQSEISYATVKDRCSECMKLKPNRCTFQLAAQIKQ